MAKAAKLKAFRTAVGFHDAYVAAPSKKAARQAWGTKKDLFGRGATELVTDEKLSAEPLANPGKVIKRSRGTTAEQIAALPPNKALSTIPKDQEVKPTPPTRKRLPKPSRTKVDTADRAIDEAEVEYRRGVTDLKAREAKLAAERRQLEKDHDDQVLRLVAAADDTRDAYDLAMAKWEG
jgi:hypothetical protein